MTLWGTCADCGAEGVALRYKPAVPQDQQARPTICDGCHTEREVLAEEHRQSLDLAGHEYDAPPHVARDERGGGE